MARRSAAIATGGRRTVVALAELFRALGDPTRLRLLSALVPGEVRVGDLAVRMGMSQSAVSHSLAVLRRVRLVVVRRAGKGAYYALGDRTGVLLLRAGLRLIRGPAVPRLATRQSTRGRS